MEWIERYWKVLILVAIALIILVIAWEIGVLWPTGGALVGGTFGALLSSWYAHHLALVSKTQSIRSFMKAQVKFTYRKAIRFKDGKIDIDAFREGKPLYKTVAENIGLLTEEQVSLTTDALLLYFEVAKMKEESARDRANELIAVCEKALRSYQ